MPKAFVAQHGLTTALGYPNGEVTLAHGSTTALHETVTFDLLFGPLSWKTCALQSHAHER